MKTIRNIAVGLVLSVFLTLSSAAFAQPVMETDSLELEVCFRCGYRTYESQFRGNGKRMEEFVQKVEACMNDSLCHIKSIDIVGSASPEGQIFFNRRLAMRRAETVKACLTERLPALSGLMTTRSVGIDWKGLESYVRQNDIPHRESVLRIITTTPELTYSYNGRPRESRKLQLIYLNDGKDWQYLLEQVFPNLRSGSACVSMVVERRLPVVEEPPVEPTVEPTPETNVAEEVVEKEVPQEPATEQVAEPVEAPKKSRTPWLAIKTNLLSDVALMPQIGVEACLGNRVSLSANWTYSWWKTNRSHWYWQTYGGDVDLRIWLGKRSVENRLTGHHIGVYGQMFTFDYEVGKRGLQVPNWAYSVGVEYGYSLPIGRRLNLDFSIAAGYIHGELLEYLPIDNHYVWQATKTVPPICLTKAEISLVWLIGRNRQTEGKKGGRR